LNTISSNGAVPAVILFAAAV